MINSKLLKKSLKIKIRKRKSTGLAGFEPATSQSEAGHPFWQNFYAEIYIQTRLQAQSNIIESK